MTPFGMTHVCFYSVKTHVEIKESCFSHKDTRRISSTCRCWMVEERGRGVILTMRKWKIIYKSKRYPNRDENTLFGMTRVFFILLKHMLK